jgi:hypothetical protein
MAAYSTVQTIMTHIVRLVLERAGWYEDKDNDGQSLSPSRRWFLTPMSTAWAKVRGQDGPAARTLPLSVDGLILAASLVLPHRARNDRDAPGLARLMLWLGISVSHGDELSR